MKTVTMVAWEARAESLRGRLGQVLGLPAALERPRSEIRRELTQPGFRLQCLIYETEPGQFVTAHLYLPDRPAIPVPAFVVTCGHGGSKSVPDYQYFGQICAKLGYACLIPDPIGEEERQKEGRLGTRDHDKQESTLRSERTGRNIMGKFVWDTMAGINYLTTRAEIDAQRLAVTGYSLGGAVVCYLIGLEKRLRAAIPVGWACRASDVGHTKACTSLPLEKMLHFMSPAELIALGAPHCAVMFALGDSDRVLDHPHPGMDGTGMRAVRQLTETLEPARQVYDCYGCSDKLQLFVEPGADHQPLQVGKRAMAFAAKHLGAGRLSEDEILALPEIRLGTWLHRHQLNAERLYSTPTRMPGTRALDLDIRPFSREELSCLSAHELGDPSFTIDGWLDSIER